MRTQQFFIYILFLLSIAALVPACKKGDSLQVPPLMANFTNERSGSYTVSSPSATYKIPVGLTTISTEDRTTNISVSSPTGAVLGTHFTVDKLSVLIPAGKVVDSITVQGVHAQYLSGRKDTLVFTIQETGAKPSDYNNTFTLFMRGPCFASDINTDLNSLLGTYANTRETLGSNAYGPYTTTISAINKLSATTAEITVTNIYDDNPTWNPLKFTLDWSDLANPKITLQQQVAGGNAGNTFGSQYAGQPHAVRPVPGGTVVGTFDFCAQKLTLRMQVGISGVGFSTTLYTVNLAR